MKHIWTVLCQKSSIDFESNLVSMFSCLEELTLVVDKTELVSQKLVIPVEIQLVSFWTVSDQSKENSLEFKGELLNPAGQVINNFSNQFSIDKGVQRFRNRTNIQGLPVTDSGRYYFRMSQRVNSEPEFRVVAELPLDVKISYKIIDKPGVKKS